MPKPPALAAVLALVAGAALLAACGDGGTAGSAGRVRVEAAFYPLEWVTQRVGGDHVDVHGMTKPGAEPHDLELSPSEVAAVSDADVVVYLHGFQPAVDDAVDEASDRAVLDVAPAAGLDLTFTPIDDGEQRGDDAGTVDPHFWLDPTKLSAVATAVADRLEARDPDHAADYAANLATVTSDLAQLDGRLRAGLAHCTDVELVTSHNAFGYLARRYGLHQVGIAGLTPEQEPSPADLADVSTFAREHDVRTIYFETLASPDVARTVAAETGAATAVLDPLEGLNDESQGHDYLEVMDANLASLRAGQACT